MPPDAGRMRWRCRRGMKELDILLERFVNERYLRVSAAEQAAFQRLLEVQDPLIYAYCLRLLRPPSHFAVLIERITADSCTDP
ncbi:MAG TPA: succinate dehydrogenase assembly factor 2 [Steroidobacteraceae bacterium]